MPVSSDDDSSDSDGPPPLVPRLPHDSSDSDDDSSDSDGPPPLVPKPRQRGNSDDDDDSSDSDGPPPLVPRPQHDSSDDDDESSESDGPPPLHCEIFDASSSEEDVVSEFFMPFSRKTKKAPKMPPANQANQQLSEEEARLRAWEQRERERKRRIEAAERQKKVKEFYKRTQHKAAIKITNLFKLPSRIVPLQARWRGIQTRRTHAPTIERLQEFKRFYSVWGEAIRLIPSMRLELSDWASQREKNAYIRQQDLVGGGDEEEEERKETDEKLTSSMEDAMKVMEENANVLDDDIEEVEGLPLLSPQKRSGDNKTSGHSPARQNTPFYFKKIHLSGEVVKWLRNGDPKYVDFFVRRMKQLSSGERSRILAKRLNGSTTAKVPIYETYLEQKSGFRILWTEKDDYMLVWYVAKHHRVTRLMRLIDDSKNRSERQRVSINDIDEMTAEFNTVDIGEEKHEILLDPLGNVPLKVYDVGADEIENITKKDWTPALHLTEEERRVVETEGTVLLLGRSGTGKTICICNRMEYDRQKHSADPLFSQLFIARSPRLCTYVKNSIVNRDNSEFATFDLVLLELEKSLPKVDGIRDVFPQDLFMKFSTFKRDVYDGGKGIDALIVWTNIRSFLKGSIEALQNTQKTKEFFVSEEEFLSETVFGKRRCRLAKEQRQIIYEIFLSYKQTMDETNAWDNCDRIVALIQRLQAAKRSHPDLFRGPQSWCKWSKIYVDEVQDYTQSEILLFFHLSGAGNLFLAGDPAQNVTKGVEFRFDDIRSVGYHIAGENRKLIPQKPKIVNINFRSHAGILNAAAAILSMMFAYFPDSTKQLGKDDGLFKGPRPGYFHRIKAETMAELLKKNLRGTVVLTHDEYVERVVEKLGGYELVYGIRKAKGLEFKSVVIMDFVSSLPKESQKPWREMLLNRGLHDFKNKYPEVEGQLKLLYTGVTRCIDRLFFAETESSLAGDAFLRWSTCVKKDSKEKNSNDSQAIATKNNIENVENMTMTPDEWLASGITNAEAAEVESNMDNAHARSLMKKAIYCFQQAGNDAFEEKAKIHASSFEFRGMLFDADRLGSTGNPFSQDGEAEKAAAELLTNLLKQNLLVEARVLCREISKMVQAQYPSSPHLDNYVLCYLPVSKEMTRVLH